MAIVDKKSSNDEKVVFFRSLFSGRGDVFAKRYDNVKTGKKGYSPYCENQWVRGLCGLMHGVKCSDCPNRKLKPVSDEVIRWHLRGKDGGRFRQIKNSAVFAFLTMKDMIYYLHT